MSSKNRRKAPERVKTWGRRLNKLKGKVEWWSDQLRGDRRELRRAANLLNEAKRNGWHGDYRERVEREYHASLNDVQRAKRWLAKRERQEAHARSWWNRWRAYLQDPDDIVHFDGQRCSRAMRDAMQRARASEEWDGSLTDGLRTDAEQLRLYNLYLAGRGAPAYPPGGPSQHRQANMRSDGEHAVDVTDAPGLLRWGHAHDRHPTRPHNPPESWHIEHLV